jgi:hypothetical protein
VRIYDLASQVTSTLHPPLQHTPAAPRSQSPLFVKNAADARHAQPRVSMMNHNSMAEMSHSSDHSDMTHIDSVPKADSKDCEMTIDCECPTESEFIATIAPNILLKKNVSAIIVSINETDANHSETFSSSNSNLSIQNSYSPPPLFLANESFLI